MGKAEVLAALLGAHPSVFVHLDPRSPYAQVPECFKRQSYLVLEIGLDMPVPIPDLELGRLGWFATLSFSGRPFRVKVPWPAVFAMVTADGQGEVWEADVPADLRPRVEPGGGQTTPRKRGHLRRIK